MANVFISYARRDKERVVALTTALEAEGLSVWWDSDLVPGRRYRQVIADQLTAADCVIVVWTAASLDSDWVQDEAEEGRQRGVLIPVMLEPVRAPAGFRQVQSADLSQWTGAAQHPEFRSLVFAVRSLVQIARAAGQSAAPPPPGAVADPPLTTELAPVAPTRQPEPMVTVVAPAPGPIQARKVEPERAIFESVAAGADNASSDRPRTATIKRPSFGGVTHRLADVMFGWACWIGVGIAMAACVVIIGLHETGEILWPYALCVLPLLGGAAAAAGRRRALDGPARAIAAWCGVGGGLAVWAGVFGLSHNDRSAAFYGLYFALLVAALLFALAIGGLILGQPRRRGLSPAAERSGLERAGPETSVNQRFADLVFAWPLWLVVAAGMAACAHAITPRAIVAYLVCGVALLAAAIAGAVQQLVPKTARRTIAAWITVAAGVMVGLGFMIFLDDGSRRRLVDAYMGLLGASVVFILASGVLILIRLRPAAPTSPP